MTDSQTSPADKPAKRRPGRPRIHPVKPPPVPRELRPLLERQPLSYISPVTGKAVTHLPEHAERYPGEIISLGIDPGLTGAWSCVGLSPDSGDWRVIAFDDLPTITFRRNNKNRSRIDVGALTAQLRPYAKLSDVICSEIIFAPPGIASTVAFSLGMTAAGIMAALDSLNVKRKTIEVSPKSWKSHLRLTADKADSLTAAENIFGPAIRQQIWRRVKDHNRAESALIAVWAAVSAPQIVAPDNHSPFDSD